MIEYFLYWTVFSIIVFVIMEEMSSLAGPGVLKHYVIWVLRIVYAPLYLIGGVLLVLHKAWIILRSEEK